MKLKCKFNILQIFRSMKHGNHNSSKTVNGVGISNLVWTGRFDLKFKKIKITRRWRYDFQNKATHANRNQTQVSNCSWYVFMRALDKFFNRLKVKVNSLFFNFPPKCYECTGLWHVLFMKVRAGQSTLTSCFLMSYMMSGGLPNALFIKQGCKWQFEKKQEHGQIPSKQAENESNCQIWETKKQEFLFKQESLQHWLS